MVVDVEGFGDRRRTDSDQVEVRAGLYQALRRTFDAVAIPLADCDHEDRGDGALILAPPHIPKNLFVAILPEMLARALAEHNRDHTDVERIRLRVVLHAGEVKYDEHGVTSASINFAFRLLESRPLKTALATSPGVLALMTSSWFFDEVVRHDKANRYTTYRPVRVSVKETSAIGWIALPDHPYPADEAAATTLPAELVPAELPADILDFTGRAGKVREVHDLAGRAGGGNPTAVVISAISGMAGIGKTALAVHVAHLLRTRFPDGQLYVNLRGAEAQALDPAKVLVDFLRELGMVDIPKDLAGRAAAYRSRIGDRRMLVLLDNAADEDQVLPLLPGSPSCSVLITSRVRLSGIAGARLVMVDVLEPGEAVKLLGQIAGAERVAAEPGAADEIARICGRLPIAIRVAGAVLAKRPGQRLDRFVEQLHEQRPLNLLGAEGGDDVRLSFSLSYRSLPVEGRQLFGLLGMLRAPDFPAWVGAMALGRAHRGDGYPMIERLVDAQLLQSDSGYEDEAGQSRYHFHDLLREFAQEQLKKLAPADFERDALQRVLNHYLVLSQAADEALQPRGVPDLAGAGLEKSHLRNGAFAWFSAERVSLVAAVEQAFDAEMWHCAWQLATSLTAFFERSVQWDLWQHTSELALTAAQHAGDRKGEAWALRSLGYLAREMSQPGKARSLLLDSLRLFQAVGDRFGEAYALCSLTRTHRDLGQHTEAVACYELAMPMARANGHLWLEANLLRDIGMVHRDHGSSEDALACLKQALPLFHSVGDQLLETYTVRDMGMVHQREGQYAQADECFKTAKSSFSDLGDRRGVARALNSLGDSHREQHRWPDADRFLRDWLEIFRELCDLRWEAYTLRSLGDLHRAQAVEIRRATPAWRRALSIRDVRTARGKEKHHYAAAVEHLLESRRLLLKLGNRPWEANTLSSLGEIHLAQGEWDEAIRYFDQCFSIFLDLDDRQRTAETLTRIGHAQFGRRNWKTAQDVWSTALDVFNELRRTESAAQVQVWLTELAGHRPHRKRMCRCGLCLSHRRT
ncbi:MAG: tetratricopeptide repeat protein [Kibdelosporangium sp.]